MVNRYLITGLTRMKVWGWETINHFLTCAVAQYLKKIKIDTSHFKVFISLRFFNKSKHLKKLNIHKSISRLIDISFTVGIFWKSLGILIRRQKLHEKGFARRSPVKLFDCFHVKLRKFESIDIEVLGNPRLFYALWDNDAAELDQIAQQNLGRSTLVFFSQLDDHWVLEWDSTFATTTS